METNYLIEKISLKRNLFITGIYVAIRIFMPKLLLQSQFVALIQMGIVMIFMPLFFVYLIVEWYWYIRKRFIKNAK